MLVLHIPKVPLYFGLGANFLGGTAGGAQELQEKKNGGH
jgi:hypothetical protein